MTREAVGYALLSLVMMVVGCQSSEDTGRVAQLSSDASISPDATRDSDGSSASDPSGCTYQSDCLEEEFCDGSTCREAESCRAPGGWETCVPQFAGIDEDLAERAICRSGHCQVACVLDRHCRDGRICTDNGRCREFTGEITGQAPGGEARQPLRSGVGRAWLDVPIGLPLGGYGSRAGLGDGRYADQLRASHGQMHGLEARALLLDNGDRQIMLIRLPIIFSSMALHEAVARRLQARTGADWRDSLVISATHTHSGPARFYHIPDDTLVPVGRFGIGAFHQKAFDWLVDSTVRAAEAALEDRSPASIGVRIVENFDPNDDIARDRWEQSPPFDDNRLLLIRVDDLDGRPRAVAVSFGMHGTIHSGDYANGDAPGAIEHGLERALADAYDHSVPVMFFNQNGGTMSPGGDERDHEGAQRFDKLGHEFAEIAMPELDSMETRRSIELAGETHRFPITYDLLGYEAGEWGRDGLETIDQQYTYGGIQCSGNSVDTDDETRIAPDDLECFGLHRILYHRPPTLFLRSQMTALTLGEHTLLTLPGEASMEVGWQVIRRLRETDELDPSRSWTLGYAQDHQFYLMPTNLRGERPPFAGFEDQNAPESYPDYAFSYLQGGYEPSMSFWGWRLGDFLVARASEAVDSLRGDSPSSELPDARPKQFSRIDESFGVEPSDPERVGEPVESPPETVERFRPIEFAWVGGDSGVEKPQAPRVVLERQTDEGFAPVETSRARPYDNREPVMMTRRRRDEQDNWVWVVYWEEERDFPTGTYRFRVEGHHQVEGNRQSYETTSRPFEVVPYEQIEVGVAINEVAETDDLLIEGELAYPPAEALEYTDENGDPGSLEGHYRMRGPDVPTGVPGPLEPGRDVEPDDLEVEIRRDGEVVQSASGAPITLASGTEPSATHSELPITEYRAPFDHLSPGTYQVVVSVTDAHGNTGRGGTEVTLP